MWRSDFGGTDLSLWNWIQDAAACKPASTFDFARAKFHRLKSVLRRIARTKFRRLNLAPLAAILLLAMAPAVQATTYYVAAAGSDANSGTSSATAWQTIAKVNATTFAAGDSVLFNRGDIWYGTSLIAPST